MQFFFARVLINYVNLRPRKVKKPKLLYIKPIPTPNPIANE